MNFNFKTAIPHIIAVLLFLAISAFYLSPAFEGFSHPAVITVALVLLISKGLERSGFISVIGRKLQAYANSEIQFMISILENMPV